MLHLCDKTVIRWHNVSPTVSAVVTQLNYVVPFFFCIFKSCHKIWSTAEPEVLVFSPNYCTVQQLFSSMHCSIMATDMSVWMDTEYTLWCMSAVDTLPLPNTHSHHATMSHGRERWPIASCYSACHSCVFMPQIAATRTYKQCSTLKIFSTKISNTIIPACKLHVHVYIYSHIWLYHLLAHALECIYCFPHCHICGAPDRKTWLTNWLMWCSAAQQILLLYWTKVHVHSFLYKYIAYLPEYKTRFFLNLSCEDGWGYLICNII